MLKRMLSLFLALAMLASACPVYAAEIPADENTESTGIVEALEPAAPETTEGPTAGESVAVEPETETPTEAPAAEAPTEAPVAEEPVAEEPEAEPPIEDPSTEVATGIMPGYNENLLFEPGYDASLIFLFTTQENGTFVVWSDPVNDATADFRLRNDTGTYLDAGTRIQFSATAGRTYVIEATNYYSTPMTLNVRMDEVVPATGITLLRTSVSGLAGDSAYVPFRVTPSNADVSTLTWTVADTSVAEITYTGSDSIGLELKKVGTTTLTGTCGSTTATCEITVTEPLTLTVGYNENLPFEPGYDAGLVFLFTPQESGTYVVWSDPISDATAHFQLYDENGEYLNEGERIQFSATAGRTYVIEAVNHYSTSMTLNVRLDEIVPATGVTLLRTSVSGLAGDSAYVPFRVTPGNADVSTLTWTVADTSVAEITYTGSDGIELELKNAGTTTLTGTCGSATATCEITVAEPLTLTVGYNQSHVFTSESTLFFRFTAPKTATYVMWMEGDGNAGFTVRSESNWLGYSEGRVQFDATQGETYTIEVNNYYLATKTYQLRLEESVALQSLTLSKTELDVQVGGSFWLDLSFNPIHGAVSGETEWTVSDPSVLDLEGYNGSGASFYAVGPGTATITASCGSTSASCTVTVRETPTVTPGYCETMVIPAETDLYFQFTAPKTATYIFWESSGEYLELEARHGNYYIGSGSRRIAFDAVAGETYTLGAQNFNDTRTYTLNFDEAAELTSFTFTQTAMERDAGQYVYLELNYDPFNGAESGGVIWTISDNAIARLNYSGSSGAGFDLLAPGTVTITATHGRFSTSCTITVTQPTVIQDGFSSTVTLKPACSKTFSFTPATSGGYVFWNESNGGGNLSVLEGDNYIAEGSERVQFYGYAGTTYRIQLDNYSSVDQSYTVSLKKGTKLTGLSLSMQTINALVGEYYYIEPLYTPANAYVEDLEYVYDEDMITVQYQSATGAGIRMKKAGTSTFTVKADGKSASCTITVIAPTAIQLGHSKTHSIKSDQSVAFDFTPTTTGKYVFWEDTGAMPIFQLYNNGSYVDVGYGRTQFEGVAGTTYTLMVSNYSEKTLSIKLRLEKAATLTGFELVTNRLDLPVGYGIDVPIIIQPANGWVDQVSAISDTGCVKIEYTDDSFVYLSAVKEGSDTVSVTINGIRETFQINVGESGPSELSAPVISVSGNAETGKNVISWDSVPGAVTYNVYRSTSKTGKYTLRGTVDSTAAMDMTAEAGTTYYYYVTAVDSMGNESEKSSIKSRCCDLPCPVITVSNTASSGKSKIKWDKVDGAKEYKVYRADDPEGKFTLVKTTTSSSYTDSDAGVGEVYFYKVKAIHKNSSANSAYSDIYGGFRVLAQPKVEASVSESTGNPLLTWEKVDGAQAYRVLRSIAAGGPYEELALIDDTSYEDDYAEAGRLYFYQVVAFTEVEAFCSAPSKEVEIMGALAQPVIKTSGDAGSGKNIVSWEAVAGATEYKVYRATSKTGKYSRIATTSELSILDETCEAGTTYYYKVKAVQGGYQSDSAYSSIKSRTCDLPSPVITVSNTASSGKSKLSWAAVEGAKEYTVYRATAEDGKYSSIGTTTKAYYTDSDADIGTTCFYKVKAVHSKSSANSAYSNILSSIRKLAYPSVTLENDDATGKLLLTWSEKDEAIAYDVYRSLSGAESYTKLARVTEPEYLDLDAEAGKTYDYKVLSVAGDESLNSAFSKVDTGTCKLNQPVIKTSGDAESGKNLLTWEPVEGAVKYRVYRATSKSGSYKSQGYVTEPSFLDKTAAVGTTYYYKVKAYAETSAANSAYSPIKSRCCDLPSPEVTISNTASSGKVKLSWEKVTGAKEYKVYRATEEDGKYTSVKTTTSTSYTDSDAEIGVTYYYKVKAIHKSSSANSAYTPILSGFRKLARPSVELDHVSSTGKIELTWKPVDEAVSYNVYRLDGDAYVLLGSTEDTEFVDTTAESGKTYSYRVKAVGATLEITSASSSTDTGVCKLPRPTVTLDKSSKGKPVVSWEAVEGAVKYEVYRATSKSGTYSKRKTTTSLSYTDTSASNGRTYYYKVKAVAADTDATSAYSSTKSIKAG